MSIPQTILLFGEIVFIQYQSINNNPKVLIMAKNAAVAEATQEKKVYEIQIEDTLYKTTIDSVTVDGLISVLKNRVALGKSKNPNDYKRLKDMFVKIDGVKMKAENMLEFVHEVRKENELAYAFRKSNENAAIAVEQIEAGLKKAMSQKISFSDLAARKFDGIIAAAGLNADIMKSLGM